MKVEGNITNGFEKVADAFKANFLEQDDVGASCCIYQHGKPVVNIWGGIADTASQTPWTEQTTQLCFSATKGLTVICVLQLVEQGLLNLDAPIAHYWPEFGCQGKENITPRMVLSHRAGLAAVLSEHSLQEVLDWQPVVDGIAQQKTLWEPNTTHGYHIRSFGWILGELVRRVTGQTLGTYLATHIAQPLSADFWVGVPESELERCATLIPDSTPLKFDTPPSELTVKAFTGPSNLFGYNTMWNDKALLMAELPSSNGVGSAAALAKIYAATVSPINGIQLLNADTIAQACEVQSQGIDSVIGIESCFGLGFMLPPWLAQGVCGPKSYGHFGAGGSFGMADTENGLSFAYLMNKMSMSPTDTRALNLVKAMYASL